MSGLMGGGDKLNRLKCFQISVHVRNKYHIERDLLLKNTQQQQRQHSTLKEMGILSVYLSWVLGSAAGGRVTDGQIGSIQGATKESNGLMWVCGNIIV